MLLLAGRMRSIQSGKLKITIVALRRSYSQIASSFREYIFLTSVTEDECNCHLRNKKRLDRTRIYLYVQYRRRGNQLQL